MRPEAILKEKDSTDQGRIPEAAVPEVLIAHPAAAEVADIAAVAADIAVVAVAEEVMEAEAIVIKATIADTAEAIAGSAGSHDRITTGSDAANIRKAEAVLKKRITPGTATTTIGIEMN